jgi:serine/threonine protein kinase
LSPSPKLPKYLGDYAVLRPLSKGRELLRFAVRSEPQEHPRLYVVKLFPPVPAGTPEVDRERYVPRLSRGLSHRNLVESYQAGEFEGLHYLVMEYVLSVDLAFVLNHCREKGERIPLEVVLYTGREICRGLAFLHGFGADKLLHGRLAPSHVLMAYSGQLKLAHVHRLLKVGQTTEIDTGEPDPAVAYQAPELLEGRPVDQRADVFAAGAILWEALAGHRFEMGPDPDAPRTVATEGRIPLTDFNPDTPEDVTEVIQRALRPRPEDRFRSAVDLGRRLDALLERHCPGAGGRAVSDWLVGRFRDELRARRRIQQQLLAEKRAETASHRLPEMPEGVERRSGDLVDLVLDQRYRIRSLLGEGGMGQVYEAEHVQLGKRLAVKVLHPLYSTEDEVVERFRREARSASSIGHPNIVNVTDSGTTPDGRAYFVMELLDGMELADVITQEGTLDYERAVDIAIQVAQALGAAHKVGIIHRDMKPENVFLTTVGARTDVVKILDFGIAKSARLERVRGGQLTEPGLAVGTPEYMAPEQAAGKLPDPRFDIYSVGGILYAVLTGRPPHRGGNVMEILTRKATRNPTPPRSYRPDIPAELERAIMMALSRNPERRPQSMEEFEYELRKSLQGRPHAVAHMLGISDAVPYSRPGGGGAGGSDSGEMAARRDSGEMAARRDSGEMAARPGSGERIPRAGSGEVAAGPGAGSSEAATGPAAGEGNALAAADPAAAASAASVPAGGADAAAGTGEEWGLRTLEGSPADTRLQVERPKFSELDATADAGFDADRRGAPGGQPPSGEGAPGLADDELFSPSVTPTDLVQWDEEALEEAKRRSAQQGRKEALGDTVGEALGEAGQQGASRDRPAEPLDERATSVYVPTASLRRESERRRVNRQAGLVAAGLLAGVGLIALLLWLLWPPPASQSLPPPSPGAARSAPAAATGMGSGTGREDPSERPTAARRPIAVVGLSLPPDATVHPPEARARFRQRAVKRWVAFAWRAARDRRYLAPEQDCVLYGLRQLEDLAPDHEQLPKLRAHATRRLLWRALRQRRRGDYEQADETLRGLLEIAPDSDRARDALASLLVARGKRALKKDELDEAEAFAKEALSLDDEQDDPAPLLLGAAILEARDKLEDARAAYRLVLKKDRRNREARRALRRLRRKLRRR